MKKHNASKWVKAHVETHVRADLSEHQYALLSLINVEHPNLNEILTNGWISELNDEELKLVVVNSEMNPYVVLGICSKYKLGKRLAVLKASLGTRYHAACRAADHPVQLGAGRDEEIGSKLTNVHGSKAIIGAVFPDEDMPKNAQGDFADFNPHHGSRAVDFEADDLL